MVQWGRDPWCSGGVTHGSHGMGCAVKLVIWHTHAKEAVEFITAMVQYLCSHTNHLVRWCGHCSAHLTFASLLSLHLVSPPPPPTPLCLQVQHRNNLKDFVHVAGTLGVSHFLMFSTSDTSTNLVS